MYVMRYALCVMRQIWRLLKCSRVNPYVRMRIRFSNSCASEKLDRSVSRLMRHLIEKTEGEFQGMTSTTGSFPDKVPSKHIHSSNAVSMLVHRLRRYF